MAAPLQLPHGNLITPHLIKGVTKFPKKGVGIRNEYNKLMDFVPLPDARAQDIFIRILYEILSTKDWMQPDWEKEFQA